MDPASRRAAVVDLLTALGLAMKRKGDTGRARAYMHAANAVARREDFDALLAAGRLREIRGVGASIEATVRRFVEAGEYPAWLAEADGWEDLDEDRVPSVPRAWREAPFADAPDLHVHSTWSDGTLTLDEIAAFAKRLGATAVGVSDHSGGLKVARGLAPDDVRRQWEDVARVQATHPDLRILRGTECDIRRDGSLDHPEEILAGFDYVIGSLHSQLKLPEKEQTERVLAALEHERLTVLGHPTTRIPGHRPRANLDLDAVFAKAAERGVAMEVNGNPGRVDLDAALARRALAAGCRLSLGSDAHSRREMLALLDARRIAEEAGARREDLVNYVVGTRRREGPGIAR